MEYRSAFGRDISLMSLGTVQLGLKYGIANRIGKPTYEQSIDILTTASNCGVNCFDTAARYGDSEKIIGNFLTKYTKDISKNFIISKLPSVKGMQKTKSSLQLKQKICTQVRDTINNLQSKYVDALILHDSADLKSFNGLVLSTLIDMKDEGLIQTIGISVYELLRT